MALFRQHVSIGAIVAVVGVVLTYYWALVTDWHLLAMLFAVTVFASFLPDIDSDSGIPFHLIYGSFSVLIGGLVLYDTLLAQPESVYEVIGRPLLALLLVWFVGGEIFKRFTTHRGMMHSIPVALIVGIVMFLLSLKYTEDMLAAGVIALGSLSGFLSHLVLDEVYASVRVDGAHFSPKRSLGTALKLFSSSTSINLITYCALCVLAYHAVRAF